MKSLVTALVTVLLLSSTAFALDKPKGEVVLTIKGQIDNANGEGVALFDRDMLSGLEGRQAEMQTPWATTPTTFAGPYLKAVLEAAGARGKRLVVRALNDYAAEIPIEDAYEFETILADSLDGKPMSVRDKGPLMVVYPFDKEPRLYNERYFARSVWQVKEIEVLP
ncbi:molybdopterin-dependent oxidoreductase [Rhizobium sp. RU36D]|uniref:molybdopterin-dependent oxidoreductase n=1 Tax=Rhizobium sp. RU36D TaxID=1907415 RepID=UPI0009D889F7|nr:molybdopterin-dependent oxidoreductase [Rhizobium sp. RU36D]SMD04180.1 hypothetical protein SAMN05880593_11714 [Rhizobium sp. RU36D]